MARMTRPPYILAHIADLGGCGYHRIVHPMEALTRHGYINGKVDMSIWVDPAHNLKALNPDVVIWQRQHEDSQIANIIKYREMLPNAFQVWEVDDILSAVPDWSPHKHLIPKNIDDKMRKAVSACDVVITSTEPLAKHIRRVCEPGTEVRVVPNMLTAHDLQLTTDIKNKIRPQPGRVRIGWMGGIGHKGDLDLLTFAMRELSNKGVDWVFFGQRPYCEVPVEFHGGVSPKDYLAHYASLNLDLALAPLENNMFNECKSNLRMLEAGLLGLPVIASRMTPYLERNPPVFAYADTPEEWLTKIQEFIANRDAGYNAGLALQKWVKKNYIIDEQLERRTRAWLPRDKSPFVPKQRPPRDGGVVIVSPGKATFPKKHTVFKTLQAAVSSSTGDVVYIRPGASITENQIERLLRRLRAPAVSSVSPMSNDGGIASFPQHMQFTPVDPSFAEGVDDLCRVMFSPVQAEVAAAAGPVIALSRVALDICGAPEEDQEDSEAAIIEWSSMASGKGLINAIGADTYVLCPESHKYSDIAGLFERVRSRYHMKQLAPDPCAGVRWELDLEFHRRNYKTPLPSANGGYPEWSALFNIPGDRDCEVLSEAVSPVPLAFVPYPTTLDALRELVTAASDIWAVFYDSKSIVAPHAAYMIAKEIEENPNAAFIYADHDYHLDNGTQDGHFFKPHKLDIHMLAQNDYVTQLVAVPLALFINELSLHVVDGVVTELSLYNLFLKTAWDVGFDHQLAIHIPRVLVHLKQPAGGEQWATVADKCMVATVRLAEHGVKIETNPRIPVYGELRYEGAVERHSAPKVSIVIPTTCNISLISPCLTSLLAVTAYPNFEVIVVANGKIDHDGLTFLKETAAKDDRVQIVSYDGTYNWSVINNWAVAHHASGEFLLFLNDDTQIIEEHWLKEMVGAGLQNNVGSVGARLTYPHGVIQHIGVFCKKGLAGHMHKGLPEGMPGYNGLSFMSHQATAVTGACMLVKMSVWKILGGFDKTLALNFNDVAFCLELTRRGYINVVASRANLRHFEGSTRTSGNIERALEHLRKDAAVMQQRYPEPDPYWNPNFTLTHFDEGAMVMGGNFEQLVWPAAPWPWRGEEWARDTILIIGDDGTGWFKEVRNGNVVYHATLTGMSLQFARPVLANVPAMDIRESAVPATVIGKLGINKIVVRSIVGGTVEALPFFLNLGIPVVYEPSTPEAVCPRLDFKMLQDGEFKFCERGWEKRGQCQRCITQSGSVFGCVSISGWTDQWTRFLSVAETNTAPDEMTADALADLYPERKTDDSAELDLSDWDEREAVEAE